MTQRRIETLSEVRLALDSINDRLEARDRLDAERRKVDDLRSANEAKVRQELVQRTAEQGERTAKLEANWESFFGDQGAFRMVIAELKSHNIKIDRLMWLTGVGAGILVVLQLLLRGIK